MEDKNISQFFILSTSYQYSITKHLFIFPDSSNSVQNTPTVLTNYNGRRKNRYDGSWNLVLNFTVTRYLKT